MERITKFDPAYDRRDPDPNKNYGIHGVDLRMVLRGKLGAVQYVQFCNWYPISVNKEELAKGGSFICKNEGYRTMIQAPFPCDLGYHSKVPMYEGHTPIGSTRPMEALRNISLSIELGLDELNIDMPEPDPVKQEDIPNCEYLGCPCYYDGSSLNAERVFDILVEKGSDGVWKYLEEYYIDTFGKLE